MLTERWFANPDNLEDLVELLRPGQTGTPPTPRHHSSSAVPAGRSRKASGDNAGPGPAAPDWNDTPEGRAAAHRQRSMSYNSGSGSGSGSAAASPPTNPLNAPIPPAVASAGSGGLLGGSAPSLGGGGGGPPPGVDLMGAAMAHACAASSGSTPAARAFTPSPTPPEPALDPLGALGGGAPPLMPSTVPLQPTAAPLQPTAAPLQPTAAPLVPSPAAPAPAVGAGGILNPALFAGTAAATAAPVAAAGGALDPAAFGGGGGGAVLQPTPVPAAAPAPAPALAPAPVPAPAPLGAGEKPPPAPEWWAHCLAQEGVLLQGPTVQVSSKTDRP